MLIIYDTYFQICIPDNVEYAIYVNEYYKDAIGNIYKEASVPNLMIFGDIIIQTSATKYIISNVYLAFDYVMKLISAIKVQQFNQIITVQMTDLNERWKENSISFSVEKI